MIELKEIKDKMEFEISSYEKRESDLSSLTLTQSILEEIIRILDTDDLTSLSDDYVSLSLSFDGIFNKEKRDNYLFGIIRVIDKYSNYKKYDDDFEIETVKELKKYRNIINSLIEQYKKTCEKIESITKENNKNFRSIKQYNYIVDIINSNNSINNLESSIILEFMKRKNYSVEDRIIISERINERNQHIKGNLAYESEILKMLNDEVENYNMTGILVNKSKSRKEELDNTVFSIIKSINKDGKCDSILSIMPDNAFALYLEDEIEYIFKSVMNHYIISMNDYKEIMKDFELYSDDDMKETILDEYYNKKDIYNKLRDMHNDISKDKEPIEEEIAAKRDLIFLKSGEQSSFFERDIEKLPKTMLDTVKYLLEGFVYDNLTISEIKSFGSANKNRRNFIELKSGQIRIVCINISNNNYAVMGVGIKKSDMDRNLYDRFEKRQSFIDSAYNSLESDIVHQRVLKYIELNSRKGNR